MAPRPYWKGYLRLSLVSCPIALYPATSEREKISFNQLNRETGHRIRYRKVDAETGEEVPSDQIVKGYEVAKGEYVEITDEELEAVSLESTKTIEIDEFVPRNEIDELYNIRPYYIAPDGNVGEDAFVVIRNVIEQMKMVAIGRVVLTSREHVIAMVPRGKGLMGTLLRYPYEVRDAGEYLRRYPGREAHQGHDGSGAPHRRNQERAFQAAAIRGSLRARAEGADREEGQGREDRSPARSGRPARSSISWMRCAARCRRRRQNTRPRAAARRAARRRGAKGNAAADFRKKGRARARRDRQAAPDAARHRKAG